MMTKDEVINILKIERECVSRDCPMIVAERDCSKCDLVQDKDVLLAAYDSAIADLEQQAHPTGLHALARAMDDLMKVKAEVKECLD